MNHISNKIAAAGFSLLAMSGSVALSTTAVVTTTAGVSVMSSTIAHAKTRNTYVQVQNLTGRTLEYVKVVHKYSDVFKESKSWSNVKANYGTRKNFKIRYNTGFGTTGQDWWYVAYKIKGEDKIRFTDPRNGRNVIDAIERLTKKYASKVADAVLNDENPKAKIAKIVIDIASNELLNNGSTSGFKKHLLRSKDQKGGVAIKLHRNGSVSFHSKTGVSKTGTSTEAIN